MDFFQPAITAFCMAMPYESTSAECLPQIVELHPLRETLRVDLTFKLVVTLHISRSFPGHHIVAGDGDQMRLARVSLPDSARGDGVSGVGLAGAHWIHPMWHGLLWWKPSPPLGYTVPKVTEGWHHLKFLPPHCDFCHWSAIYWSGQSSASFAPQGEIEIQSARYITASLVDPTGTTIT